MTMTAQLMLNNQLVGYVVAMENSVVIHVTNVPSPHNLIFLAALSSPFFAVVVVVQEQDGLLLVAPLQHLVLGLAVRGGVVVLQVGRFRVGVEGVGDKAKVPLLVTFEADRYDT